MKFDLFISDYDGTLGNAPANDIDAQTLSAIKEYQNKGGKFVVCSGREYRSIKKILTTQGLDGLCICLQGALAVDLATEKVLYNGGLETEYALEALDLMPKELMPMAYYQDLFYVDENQKNFHVYDLYAKRVELPYGVADLKKLIVKKGAPNKLGWLGEPELIIKMQKEMNERFMGKHLSFNSGASVLLEAINPLFDKGNAVRFLSKHFSIPMERIIAVGDSTNDIPLVNGEWHGVAVGDGKNELKAVAKEIAPPFDGKPVKYLLEKYCI